MDEAEARALVASARVARLATVNPGLGVDVVNMSLVTSALFAGNCDNAIAFTMAGAAAVAMLPRTPAVAPIAEPH